MLFVRPVAVAALCLCVGPLLAGAQGIVVQSGPMRVMTDTPEYCWQLAREVAAEQRAAPSDSADVHVLAREGRRMCAIGLVRGGILRLRRALMLLRSEQ